MPPHFEHSALVCRTARGQPVTTKIIIKDAQGLRRAVQKSRRVQKCASGDGEDGAESRYHMWQAPLRSLKWTRKYIPEWTVRLSCG